MITARKVLVILCGANRWDGREFTINKENLTVPIDIGQEPVVVEGKDPIPMPVLRFSWDGTLDRDGRHRFSLTT